MPVTVLFWALALTLVVDVFDHSYLILTVRNETYNKTRALLKEIKIKEAYNYYYAHRLSSNHSLLHHIWFTVLVWVVTIYFASPILLLGLVLHFACDQTYLMHNKRMVLWFKRGEYSDIITN